MKKIIAVRRPLRAGLMHLNGANLGRAASTALRDRLVTLDPPGSAPSPLVDMIDRAAPLQEFYLSFADASAGMVGLKGCGNLFFHLRDKKAVAEEHLARTFSGIQQALDTVQVDNAFWFRARRTRRMVSPKRKSIRYRFYSRSDRAHFVLERFARCERRP